MDKNNAHKTKGLNQRAQRHSNHRVYNWLKNKLRLSRGLSFSLAFWTEASALKPDHQVFYGNENSIFPESLLALSRWPKSQKTVSNEIGQIRKRNSSPYSLLRESGLLATVTLNDAHQAPLKMKNGCKLTKIAYKPSSSRYYKWLRQNNVFRQLEPSES